jgi:hypothetical protein
MEFLGNGFWCGLHKGGLNEMQIRSRKAARWLSRSNLLHYLVTLILQESVDKETKTCKCKIVTLQDL